MSEQNRKVPSKVKQRIKTFSGDPAYLEIAMQEFFDSDLQALEMDVRTYPSQDAQRITCVCFFAEVLEWSWFSPDGTLLKTESAAGLVIPKVKLELAK
jgi:hypothetical protein